MTRVPGMKSSADGTIETRRRRLVAWVVVLGVFGLVAVVDSSQLYVSMKLQDRPTAWSRVAVFAFVEWYIWAGLTPAILAFGRRFTPQRLGMVRWALVHLVTGAAVAAFHMLLNLAFAWNVDPPARADWTFGQYYLSVFFRWFHVEVMIYGAILGIGHAVDYYRKYRDREVRASQLEAQLAQAQLQALKMQLHPHFLFNALNAISVLVRKNENGSAVRMISGLSDLLRMALDKVGAQEVTLREEIEFLERYLSIEKIRFRDRLHVEIRPGPGTLDAMVPNLVLQPIVENALRHGIAPRSEAGRIEVSAEAAGDTLRIRVRDDGPGPPVPGESVPRDGVGLGTTRERLRQLYGDRFRLDLLPAPGGGADVLLDVPLRFGAGAPVEVAHGHD